MDYVFLYLHAEVLHELDLKMYDVIWQPELRDFRRAGGKKKEAFVEKSPILKMQHVFLINMQGLSVSSKGIFISHNARRVRASAL